MAYQKLSKIMSPEDRFWARVVKTDTCWLWEGAQSTGYGRIQVAGVMMGAHRYSYEMHNNVKVPEHKVVDHLCRVRACVNPAHLEVVSQAENLRRAVPYRKPPKKRDPLAEKKPARPVVPNSLSQYCTLCDRTPDICGPLQDHLCGECRAAHQEKARSAMEALMRPPL
jgi:hypothetical protein